MKLDKKEGITIDQGDGRALISGNCFYWDAQWANIVLSHLHGFCPSAKFKPNPKYKEAFETIFSKVTRSGEICGHTKAINDKKVKIPKKDLEAFIDSIDKLHKMSMDKNVGPDTAEFLHNFQIPNPNVMSSAWRVSMGIKRNLIVLWGYGANQSGSTILPLTPTSANWPDAKSRKDIRELFSGYTTVFKYNFGKIFAILGAILAILALVAAVLLNRPDSTDDGSNPENTSDIKEVTTVEEQPDMPSDEGNNENGITSPDTDGTSNGNGNPSTKGVAPIEPTDGNNPSESNGDNIGPKSGSTPNRTNPKCSSCLDDPSKECPVCTGNKKSEESTNEGITSGGETPAGDENPVGDENPAGDENPVEETPPAEPSPCPNCDSALGKDGTCPKCDAINVNEFTFKVNISQEKDNGSTANVVFKAEPVVDLKGKDFVVHSWTINGEQKQVDKKSKSTLIYELSYDKRYEINANVTVGGKEQRVIPYQWNSVDNPVWTIIRNKDDEYQVICSNSSRVKFEVKKWEYPKFYDQNYKDISSKFTNHDLEITKPNKVKFSWGQDYVGIYFLEVVATIKDKTNPKKVKEFNVKTKFPYLNGSNSKDLLLSKINNAKEKVYHCSVTNKDGNGTAFAVSDKYLLTNHHVVAPEGDSNMVKDLLLLSNEKHVYYARVIRSDEENDLALLEICDKNGNAIETKLPSYFIVSNQKPSKDMRVFSLGYPEGTTRFGEPDFTEGKIKGEKNGNIEHFSENRPGYSGGPLVVLDKEFAIVGVNKSGIVSENEYLQGINFATSVKKVIELFPEIFNAKIKK